MSRQYSGGAVRRSRKARECEGAEVRKRESAPARAGRARRRDGPGAIPGERGGAARIQRPGGPSCILPPAEDQAQRQVSTHRVMHVVPAHVPSQLAAQLASSQVYAQVSGHVASQV